ncbi:unnamed protein product [Euphydryas editha]|nr:unnamed protein product [Euphydryas editha]
MTLLGTVGKSYDELAEILGFSQDLKINRMSHEYFGGLLKNLNSNGTSSKTTYADAIFVDNSSQLREAYQTYLHEVYNGEARGVNFADEDVKNKINEWMSNNTDGKIPDFLQEPLPRNAKAVLLSALYFSGQWKYPFFPQYTTKLPFKKTNGQVMTDMMMNIGEFDQVYSVKDDVHLIAIPYNDSITTLYALKPRKPHLMSLTELMNKLNYTRISELIDKLESKKTIMRFPKMDLKFRASLEEPLKALGVQSIFMPGQANFALMIDSNNNKTENELIMRAKTLEPNIRDIIDSLPNPGINVDSIIHDVRITIDEYGTEATAATSGILARSAELFYADSPFYMFIRNEVTKLVTFSAVIFDPTI